MDRGDQRNTTGYRFNQRSNFDSDKYSGRFDYDLSERHTINGVFSYTNEKINDRPDVDTPSGYATVPVFNQPATRRFLATAYRWTPRATLTNEVRGGFLQSDPCFLRRLAEPAFYLSTSSSGASLPLINNPEVNTQEQGCYTRNYNIQDNAEWLRGNHSVRFGAQMQFVKDDTTTRFDTVPRYYLGTGTLTPSLTASHFPGGISTAQLGAANSLLALRGGIVVGGTQTFNPTSRTSGFVPNAPQAFKYRFDVYSYYVSDQWRLRPSLTLNLGLRYEYFTPLREANGLVIEPAIPSGKDVTSAALDSAGTVDFAKGNDAATARRGIQRPQPRELQPKRRAAGRQRRALRHQQPDVRAAQFDLLAAHRAIGREVRVLTPDVSGHSGRLARNWVGA